MMSESLKGCNTPGDGLKGGIETEIGQNLENLFSPRFKSVAAMAGWDEEALIIASLVVEDTPERSSSKHKRRSDLLFKTPPSSSSRRKRRVKRSPAPIPVVNLDEEVIGNEENMKNIVETEAETQEEKKTRGDQMLSEKNTKKSIETKAEAQEEKKKTGKDDETFSEKNPGVSGANVVLPCFDKLREELSCAICLEICFEPSTTNCGHSFCKKCLRSAADKCGKKCPKCRRLISNGRSCTVNTVLWNTIQLLFPQEVEARRVVAADNSSSRERKSHRLFSTRNPEREETHTRGSTQNPNRLDREDLSRLLIGEGSGRRRRGARPSQDGDAALALRLQRREFMEAFSDASAPQMAPTTTTALSLARANLRAMASRAVQTQQRRRGQ